MGEQARVGELSGLRVELLTPDEWSELRDARGAALGDSGHVLLAESGEAYWHEHRWRRSLETSEWVGARVGRAIVGIARVEHDSHSHRRYIKAVWTRPEHRNRGIARRLIEWLLERERNLGHRGVWIWLIPPNPSALSLSRSLGFAGTGREQSLPDGRSEVEFYLPLERWPTGG